VISWVDGLAAAAAYRDQTGRRAHRPMWLDLRWPIGRNPAFNRPYFRPIRRPVAFDTLTPW
jgi:hypothetical protein